MYTELFELCGFERAEIEAQRHRIEKTLAILKIDDEDIKKAEKRVRESFDLELRGARLLLKLWLKELLDLVLAREENRKVVYGEYPLELRPILAMKLAAKDVYVGVPGQVLNFTVGQIFDKLTPLMESGEENGLSLGSAHCALFQTHVGALVEGVIPVPDLLITGGYYCDQAPEFAELVHQLFNVPIAPIDGCMDSNWGEYPECSKSRILYASANVKKTFNIFEELTGCVITEDIKHTVRQENKRCWSVFMPLVHMVASADPQPISQVHLTSALFLLSAPIKDNEGKCKAFGLLAEEVKQRIDEGKGIVPKGAPRVYCGMMVVVDTSIMHMLEQSGLSIPIVYTNWLIPAANVHSEFRDLEDCIGEGVSRASFMHSCQGYIEFNLDYCRYWNLDGAIMLYHYACRPAAAAALMAKNKIRSELGIPVLLLEGDAYDTRNYSVGQLRTRVEAFAEILKQAKHTKTSK